MGHICSSWPNFHLYKETASRRWIPGAGLAGCAFAFVILIWYTVTTTPSDVWILTVMIIASFVIEIVYRAKTGRSINCRHSDS